MQLMAALVSSYMFKFKHLNHGPCYSGLEQNRHSIPTPSVFSTLNLSLVLYFCSDEADGSSCERQMVFGVVTAIDLLNFITAHEEQRRSASKGSLSNRESLEKCPV